MRRPVSRLQLQGLGIQIVDQKTELIADPVPASKLCRRQADPTQRVRIFQVVSVIEIDQPLVAFASRRQIPLHASQLCRQPACRERILIQLQSPRDRQSGLLIVAASKQQLGQLGLEGRRFWLGLDRLAQASLGLVELARGHLCANDAERRLLRRGGEEFFIRLGRFGIIATQQQLLRCGERLVGFGSLVGLVRAAPHSGDQDGRRQS